MQVLLDEEVVVEENDLSPIIEIEEDMAENRQIAELSGQLKEHSRETKSEFKEVQANFKSMGHEFSDVKSTTSGISTSITWIIRIGTGVILAVAAVLVFYNVRLMALGERIAALEGKGGSYTATEQALGNSNTPEEMAVNLNLLQAQIHKRTLSKDPLNAVELAQVGVTLSSVANRYPDDEAIWSAASHLVNIRYQRDLPADLPNCWDFYKGHTEDGKQPPSRPAPKDFAALDEQRVGNCHLTLDDGPSYRNSGFGKAYEHNLKEFPATKLQITAHDVIVSYDGGKMIPFSFLECRNCVFKLNVSHTPSSDGQRTVRRLLTADTSSVQILGSQSGL